MVGLLLSWVAEADSSLYTVQYSVHNTVQYLVAAGAAVTLYAHHDGSLLQHSVIVFSS